MTKITSLTRMFVLSILSGFGKKHKQVTPIAIAKADIHYESNGERSTHVYPETGEVYLSTVLYQFEKERAKALAFA